MQVDISRIIDDLRLAKAYREDADEIGEEILATLEIIQSINDGVYSAVDSLDHLKLSNEDDKERLVRRATSEVVEQISRNTSGGPNE